MNGVPYGLGCEIINRKALEIIVAKNLNNFYTKKVSSLIKLHQDKINTYKMPFNKPSPDLRFVVGTKSDYEFIKGIVSLAGYDAGVDKILEIIEKHPILKSLNRPENNINEIGLDKLILFPDKLEPLSIYRKIAI